jgi:GNAT superfamily N-acetyltransferase
MRANDAAVIRGLVSDCQRAEFGVPDPAMLEGVELTWGAPGFDGERDAWAISAPGGRLAAYAHLGPTRMHEYVHAFVHPDFSGRGLGSWLIQQSEARARQRLAEHSFSDGTAGDGGRLEQWVAAPNMAGHELMRQHGYDEVRHIWGMVIALAAPPEPLETPPGITIRAAVTEDDLRRAHAANDEAFRDSWHYEPRTYEQFRSQLVDIPAFDPSLWLLALDGDEVVGTALGEVLGERGWINEVTVRCPWRGRGVAIALLHRAFGEFYRRGIREVGLGVDAQNPTGATRLYQRAGMRVERQYDVFEKVIKG